MNSLERRKKSRSLASSSDESRGVGFFPFLSACKSNSRADSPHSSGDVLIVVAIFYSVFYAKLQIIIDLCKFFISDLYDRLSSDSGKTIPPRAQPLCTSAFYKANKKAARWIVGYVEKDPFVEDEVNQTAIWGTVGLVILIGLIYLCFSLIMGLYHWIFG